MNPTMPDDGLADTEQQFRDGLAEVARRRPPLEPIDAHSVRREANAPRRRSRRSEVWLAVAAATVVVGVALAANLGGGRQSIVAEPVSSPSAATPLVGTVWRLSTVDTSMDAPDVGRPYAFFDDMGRLTSKTLCSTFSAAYTLDRDRLTLTNPVVDYCTESPGAMRAVRFVKALGEAQRAVITGNRLLLLDGASTPLLEFTADPAGRTTTLATEPSSSSTDVEIRLRNDSSAVLVGVLVGQDVNYGTVLPGRTTSYRASGSPAYRYGYVRATVGGRHVGGLPTDYVGEIPLQPGRYTYVLTLTANGRGFDMDLEVDP